MVHGRGVWVEVTVFVADPDFTLYLGDALEVLRTLETGSVDCCVTSPPYWGLRDYGTEGQLGLEAAPGEYVERMVEVFGELRRVLTDTGTLWLNLGDSYAAGGGFAPNAPSNQARLRGESVGALHGASAANYMARGNGPKKAPEGLKPKDLVGIPWRVAFALQADGWYLRSDIVWSKPNPMPESVTDRPTKAHEYVFLLSKSARYYFDQEAVRDPAEWARWGDQTVGLGSNPGGWIKPRAKESLTWDERKALGEPLRQGMDGKKYTPSVAERNQGRNVRSVWEIATQPYPEAHFATFPEELPRRCIAAGCPEWVCRVCGLPRERLVERVVDNRVGGGRGLNGDRGDGGKACNADRSFGTVGWSDCGHDDYRPGVVLDPFMGSATTALVARKLGRRSVGIELNPAYAELAARRLQQLSLLAEGTA